MFTRKYCMAMMQVCFGGRVAEELVFNDTTTGASNDLEQVTNLARAMVMRYGMSDALGPRTFGAREELVFLGREISEQRNYSEKVARQIDEEIKRIITTAYAKAKEILTTYRQALDAVANRLIIAENIDGDELRKLIEHPELVSLPGLETTPVQA